MLSGWGVGVSRRRRLHLPRGERGVWGNALAVLSPWGRVVGECAKGTHLRGYRFIATNNLAQGVVSTL